MADDPLDEYFERLDDFLEGRIQTTVYFELEKRGEAPPCLDELADDEINRALTNLIWALHDLHIIVDDADHLTDRELYAQLLDYIDKPSMVFHDIPGAWTHFSPIGGCSEEDIQIMLRFYTDEEGRARWLKDFPDDVLPPAELPPYPRPWLPQATCEDDELD